VVHSNDSNVQPLHRGFILDDRLLDYDARSRFTGPPRHLVIREPLLDRMADALGSPAIIPIYLAFVAGFLCAGGLLVLWAKVL
jgi:hypothetical protein